MISTLYGAWKSRSMTGSACTIIVDIFSLDYLAKVFEYLSIHFIDVVDGDRSSIFEYDFALTFIDLFDDTGMLYIGATGFPAVCHEVSYGDNRLIRKLLHNNLKPLIEGNLCILIKHNSRIRQSGGLLYGIVIA